MTAPEKRPFVGFPMQTCQAPSPAIPTGTPGTYGYQARGETLLCTLREGHGGRLHVCDEGEVQSSWDSTGWRALRTAKAGFTRDGAEDHPTLSADTDGDQ